MSNSFELGNVKNYLLGLQSRITGALNDLDGTPFLTDAWQKDPGEKLQGNGITVVDIRTQAVQADDLASHMKARNLFAAVLAMAVAATQAVILMTGRDRPAV